MGKASAGDTAMKKECGCGTGNNFLVRTPCFGTSPASGFGKPS